MKRSLIVVFMFALAAWEARAQVHCELNDTFASCSQRLQGQNVAEVAADRSSIEAEGKQVNEGAGRLLAAKNTGDASVATINDFLPLLRAVLDSGGSSNEEGEKLVFEWTNPLGLPQEEQNKLIVGLRRSKLYEPLKDALTAASLDTQISQLEDRIDTGDDFTIGFSYSRASKRYGRDYRLHTELLGALLQAADTGPVVSAAEKALTDFQSGLLSAHQRSGSATLPPNFDAAFGRITISEAERLENMRLSEAAILAEHDSMRALRQGLKGLGFYGLLDLINNQPQVSLTAEYRARDEKVGPDETMVVLSYEKGWANVNAYEADARRNCDAAEQVRCLAQYLARPDIIEDLHASARVNFKVEYARQRQLKFLLPGSTPFTFSTPTARRFSLSAGYGRYLGQELTAKTRARVDASISYDDFSDDPSHQDRGLASVTVTYPVAEGFFLSFGAIYATKPEFRGEVDKEISARAGLVYKVIQAR